MLTRDLKYARVGAKAAEWSAEWRPGVPRFREFSKKCEKVAQKRGVPVGHRTFGRRPPPLRAAGEHTVLGGTPPPALQHRAGQGFARFGSVTFHHFSAAASKGVRFGALLSLNVTDVPVFDFSSFGRGKLILGRE